MIRAGLLGRKLGHSLSPLVHTFFADCDYRLFEREPDDVAPFLRSFDLSFLNVTIPYKKTVAELCDTLSPLGAKLGNVNFVTRDAQGHLTGDNTDAYGFERLLDSVGFDVRGKSAAVLGAGGAAATVKAVLESRGAGEVRFVRRGETPSPEARLIVNATPVGMFPDNEGVRIDIADYPACEAVLDLVHNPSPTRLVREARACGKSAADGLVMLIAQAHRAHQLLAQADAPMLYLYGPPASGKSFWAERIALATGWEKIDLDEEIVRRAGRTIPEIFAAEGEAGFRAREKEALFALGTGTNRVVALGGGALLDGESRRHAESSGRVVVLDCPEAELVRRLDGASRPLSKDRAALATLLESRRSHYESFSRR